MGETRPHASDRGESSDLVRATIGRWIREQREFQNLSREDLCRGLARRGLEVTPETLSGWEAGERPPAADELALVGLELGGSFRILEEHLQAALARSREEVDVGDRDAPALVADADRAARAGNYRRALSLLEAAEDRLLLEERKPEPAFRAGLLLRLAMAHMKLWHLELAGEALARYGHLADRAPELRYRGLVYRLHLCQLQGDWHLGDVIARTIEEGLDAREPRSRAETLQVLGAFLLGRGRPDEAVPRLEAARDLWQSVGNYLESSRSGMSLGHALALTGHATEGEREILRCLAESRRHGYRDVELWSLYFLGRIKVLAGDPAASLDWFFAAAERAEVLGIEEARFAALFRAWECARGEDVERRLRRLLPRVRPDLDEVRAFRASFERLASRREDER